MNKQEKLMAFNNDHILNKNELLKSLKAYIEYYRDPDNDDDCSPAKKKVLVELVEKFLFEIKKLELPIIADDWWFYDYTFKFDSINLELSRCEDITFDQNGEIDSMCCSNPFILLTVKCDYLTVEQYASKYCVTTTTVRQWLRRGKIRSAKKIGRVWLIPALADKPKRGFDGVTYTWSYMSDEIIDRFPYIEGFNELYIWQDEDNKAIYKCRLHNSLSDRNKRLELSGPDREKLELALQSSGTVEIEDLSTAIKMVPRIK